MTDDATLTIDLVPPVKHKGGELHALNLREPTAGEMAAAEMVIRTTDTPEAVRGYQIKLVSLVSGVVEEAVAEIPVGKLMQAFWFLQRFSGEGLTLPDDVSAELHIELDTPITLEGMAYQHVRLREPKAVEVRKAEGQMTRGANAYTTRLYQIHLVMNVSGLPYPVVTKLPISKLNEAGMYLQSFINAGPATGAN